ncbi:MAG: hypothetical protein F6J90_04235 [Moorea sp. SIOASIH]|uniref:hypothetical protein n=1 Tax=Moorena sp. SIOASIH TaxID=2607817 RepID=UPI0013B740E5|nr:hypothetical protein [Moorena sp. SIOASIH]NEO35564.1 hypothetical protein [Moorena sp. SIOASIH]
MNITLNRPNLQIFISSISILSSLITVFYLVNDFLLPKPEINPVSQEWVATKIINTDTNFYENYKKAGTYEVWTDRQANTHHFSLINIDEGAKKNSSDFQGVLKELEKSGQPVCLGLTGKRSWSKSERKNIVEIRVFPEQSKYDQLGQAKGDTLCEQKPGEVIIEARSDTQ